MSMTRAEAINILERKTTIPGDGYTFEQINEALDLAIAALRGPTREMVEEVWRGCYTCDELRAMNISISCSTHGQTQKVQNGQIVWEHPCFVRIAASR